MSSDRDQIFSRIREALAPLKERAPLPEYDPGLSVSRVHPDLPPWELFCHLLELLHGTPLKGLATLGAYLQDNDLTRGYCDPALAERLRAMPEFAGVELETAFDRARFDDYQFGVTRAAGAIANTGSLVLKDTSTAARLGALAPWTHVAVLDPAGLYPDTVAALADMGDDPSVIWASGPSKTADVEGILIEGVHGPGVQIVCLDA